MDGVTGKILTVPSVQSIQSKLPSGGVTIFSVMSRLAEDVGAINLGQGFPDFDCAPELTEAVSRHMREGHNQYAPMLGVYQLREALARKIEQKFRLKSGMPKMNEVIAL